MNGISKLDWEKECKKPFSSDTETIEILKKEVFENLNIVFFVFDFYNRYVKFFKNGKEVYFLDVSSSRAIINAFKSKIVFEDDKKIFLSFIKNCCNGKENNEILCRIKYPASIYLCYVISSKIVKFENDNVHKVFGFIKNVEKNIPRYEDYFLKSKRDFLTGLRNFKTYKEDTEVLLKNSKIKSGIAIIVIDVERISYINDMYGDDTGNDIIGRVAIVLQRILPKNFIYGRGFTDEFYVTFKYNNISEVYDFMKNITRELSFVKSIVDIKVVFGIYVVNDQNIPVSTMCNRAAIAKKSIKDSLSKNYFFYDAAFRKEILLKHNLETKMYEDLEKRNFVMLLQPKYNLLSMDIIGAEALVRWRRGNKFIMPEEFIPLFKENGFITRLDEFIWEEAVKTVKKWMDFGFNAVPISVNVSRNQIYNPDFTDMLLWLTEKYNIDNSMLGIELSEEVFAEQNNIVFEKIKKIRRLGFVIEMDDYGARNSVFTPLKNSNVNIVKIDKAFVDISDTSYGKIFLKQTIKRAKDLNMQVIAEGVETQEQVDFLISAGCNNAQGFFLSRPLNTDDFEYKAFYKIRGV